MVANELFGEKLEKERQQIELEKLRTAPPPRPAPEPKPDFQVVPPGLFQPDGQFKGQINGPHSPRIKALIVNPKPQPPK